MTMIPVELTYCFLLMFVLRVSGYCDMNATGAIEPSPADKIPGDECSFALDLYGRTFYLPNPNNCSQYWECTTLGDICLFECHHCDFGGCPETGALFFNLDHNENPGGPVCDWPYNVKCSPLPPTTHSPTTLPPPTTHSPTTLPPPTTHYPTTFHPSTTIPPLISSSTTVLKTTTPAITSPPTTFPTTTSPTTTSPTTTSPPTTTPPTTAPPTTTSPTRTTPISTTTTTTTTPTTTHQEVDHMIDQIRLLTSTCDGCDQSEEGGAVMQMWGDGACDCSCTTARLDKPNWIDYEPGQMSMFESDWDMDQMGACDSGVVRPDFASITWTGQGIWTPTQVSVVTHTESQSYEFKCQIPGGGLNNGQSWNNVKCVPS